MPPRRKAGAPKKVVRNDPPSVVPAAASGGPAAVVAAVPAVEEESTSTASSRPVTPYQVPDLPRPDVPDPVPASADAPADGTAEAAGEAPAPVGLPPAPRSKRVKKVALILTEDQEHDFADWYRSKEMLYNRRMAEYKRIDIKTRILDEKAAELLCTTQQLKTWIDSMRTAVGKLTDPAKKPSGGTVRVLTDRDSWIMENFGYLEKHIKRLNARKRK